MDTDHDGFRSVVVEVRQPDPAVDYAPQGPGDGRPKCEGAGAVDLADGHRRMDLGAEDDNRAQAGGRLRASHDDRVDQVRGAIGPGARRRATRARQHDGSVRLVEERAQHRYLLESIGARGDHDPRALARQPRGLAGEAQRLGELQMRPGRSEQGLGPEIGDRRERRDRLD